MADNVPITAGSGTSIATDDVGGFHFQRVKPAVGADGVAIDVSAAAPMPVYGPDVAATGTITVTDAVVAAPAGTGALVSGASTAGSLVAVATGGGDSAWNLQITGLTSGTLYFEGSLDSTTGTDGNWIAINGRQTGIVNTVLGYSTTTNGMFRGNTSGMKYIRIRSVGALTGTPAITWRIADGVGAIFLNASIPAGANIIGTARVQGVSVASTSANIAAAGTGTAGPLDISAAGNVTFIAKNQTAGTAWAGAPVLVFEQSDDSTSWAPMQVVRGDSGAVGSTHTLPANAANVEYVFDGGAEAINYVRCRVTTGPTTNPMTVVISGGGMPFEPSVAVVKSSIQPTTSNVTGNAANQTPPANGGTGLVHVSGAATVAATALVAAPGAGLSIYVTDIETTNAGASAQTITLFEGTTNARLVRYMAATGGGGVTNLRTPWKLPAATALGYSVTAAVQYYMTVSYFVAP